jgi:hypothetical protein
MSLHLPNPDPDAWLDMGMRWDGLKLQWFNTIMRMRILQELASQEFATLQLGAPAPSLRVSCSIVILVNWYRIESVYPHMHFPQSLVGMQSIPIKVELAKIRFFNIISGG